MKKRALSFEVHTACETAPKRPLSGSFATPPTMAWLRLCESLEGIERKAKTYRAYLNKLDRLIEKEPDLLDAYNAAGAVCLELAEKTQSDGWVDIAYEYYSRAFDRSYELIPDGFKGQIIWGILDNRPFLRSHHGLILCHLQSKKYTEAAKLMEKHLKWNPNDNIGIRYLMGDTYLHIGNCTKARKSLVVGIAKDCVIYPSNAYSLGLLEFKEGNYSAAARALRLGFISNVYIAEILTGRNVEKPHFYWHGSSDATVAYAKDYLIQQNMMELWQTTPQVIDFVDWLFNSAMVMRERHEWAEIREGLTNESVLDKRRLFCEREELIRKNIQEVRLLIVKRTNSAGEHHWPWEHSRRVLMLEQMCLTA